MRIPAAGVSRALGTPGHRLGVRDVSCWPARFLADLPSLHDLRGVSRGWKPPHGTPSEIPCGGLRFGFAARAVR